MENLHTQISYTNETEGHRLHDEDVTETAYTNIGELFRFLQKLLGRCIGRVYINSGAIGWVFEKKEKYGDCNEMFLQHAWVSIHTQAPTRTVEYHYLAMGGAL